MPLMPDVIHLNMWSRRFEKCISCGSNDRKHLGRGLCELCYQKTIENEHKPDSRKRGSAGKQLTRDFLITEYVNGNKSLSDVAAIASCSRQYVYKKMKEYGIPLRTKRNARDLALESGKLQFKNIDDDQIGSRTVILQKNKINETFFKNWTNGMAYVLGVIYTDGSLRPGFIRDPQSRDTLRVGRLTVSQKEPELLERILKLMNCNAKLLFRKQRKYEKTVAGEIYYFHINSDEIYDDLVRLGLSPNKSMTIQFPTMPGPVLRHFIRGCWDGDGSVYLDSGSGTVCASFVSGSYDFILGMLRELNAVGFSTRKIHRTRKSFYFRFTGRECVSLYHFLYDGVPEDMYLSRKHCVFESGFQK